MMKVILPSSSTVSYSVFPLLLLFQHWHLPGKTQCKAVKQLAEPSAPQQKDSTANKINGNLLAWLPKSRQAIHISTSTNTKEQEVNRRGSWKKMGLSPLAIESCQTESCNITQLLQIKVRWHPASLLTHFFLWLPLISLFFLLNFWSLGLHLEVVYSEENQSKIQLRKAGVQVNVYKWEEV